MRFNWLLPNATCDQRIFSKLEELGAHSPFALLVIVIGVVVVTVMADERGLGSMLPRGPVL